jgi:hypothetical protein
MNGIDIKVKCFECEKELETDQIYNLADNCIELMVKPHECKTTEMDCTLSQALDIIEEGIVCVSYFKKDGSYRVLDGYFPKERYQNRLGYVFFLEGSPTTGYEPKNLIRTGISTIMNTDGFTFNIH